FSLFGENILQLRVVLVGEREVVRFLDDDPALFGLADASAAGAVHAREQLVFAPREIGRVCLVRAPLHLSTSAVLVSKAPIGALEMPAAKIAKGPFGECRQERGPRVARSHVEPDIWRRPAGKRAPEDSQAQFAHDEA